MQDHEHARRTARHQYRYLFTVKHHGGTKDAAQWLPDLTEDDEFAVFDGADNMGLADDDGNYFGVLQDGSDSLRLLGAYDEQIAKFPCVPADSPWHGYPVYPLNEEGPTNRKNQKHRPPHQVFRRLAEEGLITISMGKRLMKGDHV